MLYTGAPQNTRRKPIEELNIEAGWEAMHHYGMDSFVVHAPYIINLANTVKPETFELAVNFLTLEVQRTAAMKSKILILHPGAHVGAGVEKQEQRRIIRGLNEVLDASADTDCCIALETMAGKGSEIGRSFEELSAAIYDGVSHPERLRVCFDTCHTHDAGYHIVHNFDSIIEEFDRILGKDQIAVFHINDSKNPCGAHKDRHANIGRERLALMHCTISCITRTLQMFRKFWKHHICRIRTIQRKPCHLMKRKIAMLRGGTI